MNRSVKQTVYMLKKHFGVRAVLHSRDVSDVVDDYNPIQNVGSMPNNIKMVLLPVNYSIQEKLGSGTQYLGDIKVGDREFLIDQKYDVKQGDYLIYKYKRYDVIELSDYEGEANFALVRNVQDES
jgi:hypothetical protein